MSCRESLAFVFALAWAAYQGYRGTVEHRLARDAVEATQDSRVTKWTTFERIVVLYVHDFAFRFICTMAGFLALYHADKLFQARPLADFSGDQITALIFCMIVGVLGVGGQLHFVLLWGRVPRG